MRNYCPDVLMFSLFRENLFTFADVLLASLLTSASHIVMAGGHLAWQKVSLIWQMQIGKMQMQNVQSWLC